LPEKSPYKARPRAREGLHKEIAFFLPQIGILWQIRR